MTSNASTISKVSGLVLDAAARNWQITVTLELGAGLVLIVPPLFELGRKLEMWAAFVATGCIIAAKILKVVVDRQCSLGNDLRRRADHSEAFAEPIPKNVEATVRRRVSPQLFATAEAISGGERAYVANDSPGAGRLCAMKIESAFWMTRISQRVANLFTAILVLMFVITIFCVFLGTMPSDKAEDTGAYFYTLYLIVPVILSTDCVVWLFKARDIAAEAATCNDLLMRLRHSGNERFEEVAKIVADYDCAVAGAIPSPNWYFQLVRPSIAREWGQANPLKR